MIVKSSMIDLLKKISKESRIGKKKIFVPNNITLSLNGNCIEIKVYVNFTSYSHHMYIIKRL